MPGFAPIPDPEAAALAAEFPPPVPIEPPGGGLSIEQLTAAAVPARAAFPDTPIDAALATAPVTSQAPALPGAAAAPPAAPVAAGPTDPVAAAATNAADARAIGQEAVDIAGERAALDTEKADKEAAAKAEKAARIERFHADHQKHRAAADAHLLNVRAKAENEPYHTFWETRDTGQKAAIAIGLILGGISWNANHVNRGVELLKDAMNRDLELQRQKHAQLWKSVDAAEQGIASLDAQDLHELSFIQAEEGAKWDAVAGRLQAMIAANKGKGDVNTAKKVALEANEKATTAWQNSMQAAAYARHLDASDAERARHDREMELARKKKVAAGGVGGGSNLDRAAAKVTKAIEAAKAEGKTLSTGEIQDIAIASGLPLVAKAGRTSLKTVLDEIKAGTSQTNIEHKLSDADANRIVRDPQTGKPYAMAETAKGAATFRDKDQQLGDAARRMRELADDIRKNGERVSDPQKIQDRVTKFKNAIIAVGIVSPLGKTNETLHLETASLGISGATDWEHLGDTLKQYVTGQGARADIVERKAHEIETNRAEKRRSLRQLTPDEIAKYSGAPAESGKLPPGAIPGKKGNQRGYMLNGVFTATGG